MIDAHMYVKCMVCKAVAWEGVAWEATGCKTSVESVNTHPLCEASCMLSGYGPFCDRGTRAGPGV